MATRAWRTPATAAAVALAAALLAGFVLAPAGHATTDWRILGPIRVGELERDIVGTLGMPDAPGSACRTARIGRARTTPLWCNLDGGTVWVEFSRWVGDCGPAEGCDRPRDCGLEGECREIVTSQVQTVQIGDVVQSARGRTRLTFDGVGLGDHTPLGPCGRNVARGCARHWNGLHFKRTFLEGLGYFSTWQGEERRGGLRMWVTVFTLKGRITAIVVEQY